MNKPLGKDLQNIYSKERNAYIYIYIHKSRRVKLFIAVPNHHAIVKTVNVKKYNHSTKL